jgi:hypothetical protein
MWNNRPRKATVSPGRYNLISARRIPVSNETQRSLQNLMQNDIRAVFSDILACLFKVVLLTE